MARTYVYKMTSDRGGAPCAPRPRGGAEPLLTLAICKPAIRRTAQPSDRLLGLSSRSLAMTDGYPLHAVIYAAVVTGTADAREYYAARSPFRARPDCIYTFHRQNGTLNHSGRTALHSEESYAARDVGRYPLYRNGRALLSRNFRYFGEKAAVISPRLHLLRAVAESLGQGHRVFEANHPAQLEVEQLFRQLWRSATRYTPERVDSEADGHAPPARHLASRMHPPEKQMRGAFNERGTLPSRL